MEEEDKKSVESSLLFKLFEHKGIFATIIGIFISMPINIKVVYEFFSKGIIYTAEELVGVIIINLIGISWVVLPSYIIFEGGKIKFEIKD